VPLITVLGAAHVHAFEPIPRNLELLARNVALNHLEDRVTVHAAAVSDRIGTLTFSVPERFWGSSRVAQDGVEQVPCTTVDALALEPALVWIDVEGHESAVLAGALSLAAVPIVLEHDPAQQGDLERLHAEIARRGGRLFDLASGDEVGLANLGVTDLLILP
jgi:FkbM family methyltransferase